MIYTFPLIRHWILVARSRYFETITISSFQYMLVSLRAILKWRGFSEALQCAFLPFFTVLSFNGETKVDASHTEVIFLKDPLKEQEHQRFMNRNFNTRISVEIITYSKNLTQKRTSRVVIVTDEWLKIHSLTRWLFSLFVYWEWKYSHPNFQASWDDFPNFNWSIRMNTLAFSFQL